MDFVTRRKDCYVTRILVTKDRYVIWSNAWRRDEEKSKRHADSSTNLCKYEHLAGFAELYAMQQFGKLEKLMKD